MNWQCSDTSLQDARALPPGWALDVCMNNCKRGMRAWSKSMSAMWWPYLHACRFQGLTQQPWAQRSIHA